MHKFDLHGWFTTDEQYSGRVASSAPEIVPTSKVVGQPYPNWTGYQWMMLNYVEPEVPPENQVVIKLPSRITKLAFLNRFTDDEAIAIDLAQIGVTVQAAAMRRYQKKVDSATFIDLSRDDTRDGVLALEAAGLIATGRALEILDAYVEEEEKYRGV